jgi:hypothetical protein
VKAASEAGDGGKDEAPKTSVRYVIFISYRHVEPDRSWAKWLHSALETYRVPRRLRLAHGLPRRIGRVFRDEEELAASPDLSTGIRKALDQSDHLVVVCSPRTPASEWVNAEVEYFRQKGRENAILALLIEGEPSKAFPPALAAIRSEAVRLIGGSETLEAIEPLAADVRSDPLEGSRYRKRMAKLRLLAAVLRCRFDELRQREQERRIRLLATVVGALAALTLIVLGLGLFAEINRERAVAERNRALSNQSLLLAGLARQETEQGNAVDGILLALEALPRDLQRQDRHYVPEAAEALYDAVLARRELAVLRPSGEIGSAELSDDGERVLTVDKSGAAQLWDRSGVVVAKLGAPAEMMKSAAFSPDATLIVTTSGSGPARIWDGRLGALVATIGSPRTVDRVWFSPDGNLLFGFTEQTLGFGTPDRERK